MLNHSKFPWLKVEKSFEEKDKPVNTTFYNRLAVPKQTTAKFNPDNLTDDKPIVRDLPPGKTSADIERLAKPVHVTPKFAPPPPPTFRSKEEIQHPPNSATYDRLAEPMHTTPKFDIRYSEYQKALLTQRDHVEALGPLQNEEYYRDMAVPLGGMDKIDLTTYRDTVATRKAQGQAFSSSMAKPTPLVPRVPGTGNQLTRTKKLMSLSPIRLRPSSVAEQEKEQNK